MLRSNKEQAIFVSNRDLREALEEVKVSSDSVRNSIELLTNSSPP